MAKSSTDNTSHANVRLTKKRVFATAMSALMIVSSTPVTAFAADAKSGGAEPAAVSAGLDPSAQGGQELAAELEKSAPKTATAPVTAEAPETAATTETAAAAPATPDAPAADTADAAAAAPATPAVPAAEQAAAAEAPAFKLADHLYDSGTLSYKFVDENGNVVNSDPVALFKVTDGGITASDPVEQDGHWVATLTIDASKVDPASFAPSWAVSDPQDYELDASQSKLTVEYKTDSTDPAATSYYATGSDRGSLVFVKKAAKPEAPAAPTADQIESLQAVTFGGKAQGIFGAYPIAGTYKASGEPTKDDKTGEWHYELELTNDAETAAKYLEQKAADPSTYVYDAGKSNTKIKLTYDAADKTWKLASSATLVFGYNVPSVDAGNLDLSAAGVRLVDDDSDDELATAPLADGTYALDASKAVPNGGGEWLLYAQLSDLQTYVDAYNAAHPDTYYVLAGSDPNAVVVLRSYGQKWNVSEPAKVYVKQGEKPEPAPAFDAQQKLNTAGIVELEAVDEDGNKLAEDTTGKSVNMLYDFPADISQYVTVTEPEQQADGTWKVVATLDTTKLPANVVTYLDSSFDPSQFELDTTASKVTVEFQTGTGKFDKNFYSSTGNLGQHAKLVFKKKAAERTQVMLHVHGADANDQGIEDLYPGLSGQKLSEVKGFEESLTADGYTFEGWYTQPDGQGEKVTGDTVLPEGASQFNIYAYWKVADTYTLSVPAEQTVTPEVAQGLRFADFSEYVKALGATGTRNGQPVDPTDDFWNVHVTDVNGNGTADFGEGKEGTYKVTFTLGDQTAVSLVTVKAAPAAPAFNLDAVANYAGNVTVRTVDADGSQLAEDTTGYSLSRLFGFPGDISQYAKASEPEQQADGTWKVTVTFDASKLDPADVLVSEAQWGDASQYEFDAADSQQTITFQTDPGSTQYYAKGSATVTYKKQAEPSVPAKPTDDQVKAALNNLVKVNDGTTEKAYGLIDGTFTVADPVKGASGTYTTVVTVKGSEAQKYVDLYNKDVSGSFVPSDTSDLLYYLTYDAKTGTWAGAAEQTFYVKASAYVVTIDLGYDADGDGANEVQILRVPVNGEVKFTFPTREGYTFVGLAFDPAGTKPFDFEKDYITGDITLYAQWKKNDDNGGQGGTNTPTTPQGDDKGDDTDGSKDQKLKGGSNEEGGKALPQTGDTDARGIAAALTVAGGMFAALGAWISRRDWKDAWKRNGR